jgi:hypothetical protein
MKIQQLIGRLKLQLRGKNHIVGWSMTPAQAIAFFKKQEKTVLTFYGYAVDYQKASEPRITVREILSRHTPRTTLINYGATRSGMGAVYTVAKSMGFTTTGIVSTAALEFPDEISPDADHICFIADAQWGGKLPDSNDLSPTSEAMLACSDILVAVGGGEISRDELLAAREQGRPIEYYPAEVNHNWALENARKRGVPPPDSFWGAVHEAFGKS